MASEVADHVRVEDHQAGGGLAEDDISGAFIDIDEWRDAPRRHRYVHGGFKDTHTRFSFYFPPKEQYRGRFIQYLEGGAGGHENLLAAGGLGEGMSYDWTFELAFEELGAYMVESNQGHFPGEGLGFSNPYELYGASARSAIYGRKVAAEMYGAEPHRGYVWGVSGGGARSGHCLENRPDVWQGGAPHAGIGQANQWSPWGLAWLYARQKFPQIIDAVEPGGSGDPFAGLTHAQREALAELYRRGWPRGAENQLAPFMAWGFPMYAMMDNDPTYFTDFWTKPGYLGADQPEALDSVLVSQKATVRKVVPASQATDLFAQMHVRLATAGAAGGDPAWSVVLDTNDPERLFMSKITILTGKAAGRELLVCGVDGDVLSPFSERAPDVFENVEPGDQVQVDNRDFVAFCHYHLYSIQDSVSDQARLDEEFAPWAVDGHAVFPQRPMPPFSPAAPKSYKRTLTNKMIYVQPTLDAEVWPTTVSPYERGIRENLGDKADDHFRMWFVENSPHGGPEFLGPALTPEKDPGVWRSRLVPYDGVTSQALRDVVRWVEEDIAPPFYTGYRLTRDNQLVLPATAAERGGVQPVVTAKANGGARAEVKVGETVTFTGQAEQPPGAGSIVSAEWDFEGRGACGHAHGEIDGSSPGIHVRATHAYAKPGTYFASFRVGAHRDGAKGRGLPALNLARVRVVVHP